MFKEFKAFMMRGNVVDLAVAVVIGAAFGAVVTAFVENIITPLVGVFGSQDFGTLSIHVKDGVDLHYGLVLNKVISFISIAAAIFFLIVKPLNIIAERRKRGEAAEDDTPAPSDEALILAEIRDLLKAQRAG